MAPLFDLSFVLRAESVDATNASLQRVQVSAEQLGVIIKKTGFDLETIGTLSTKNFNELVQGIRQATAGFDQLGASARRFSIGLAPAMQQAQRFSVGLAPAMSAAAGAAGQAERGLLGMSRSLLFVASTGNLAGRGMASLIARMGLMSGNALAAAAGIGLLAVGALFEHWEKGAEKADTASNRAFENLKRLVAEGTFEEINSQLTDEIAKLDIVLEKQSRVEAEAARQRGGAAGGLFPGAGEAANAGREDAEKETETQKAIVGQLNLGLQLNIQQAGVKESMAATDKRAAEDRALIERDAGELQTQIDAKHMDAVKLIRADMAAAKADLSIMEQAERSLAQASFAPLASSDTARRQREADAEMKRRMDEAAKQADIAKAGRDDAKKPPKEKAQADDDTQLARHIQLLGEGASMQETAAKSLLELSTLQFQLTDALKDGNLTFEQRILLSGQLQTVTEEIAKAQRTLRADVNEKAQIKDLTEAARIVELNAQAVPQLQAAEARLRAELASGTLTLAQYVQKWKELQTVQKSLGEFNLKQFTADLKTNLGGQLNESFATIGMRATQTLGQAIETGLQTLMHTGSIGKAVTEFGKQALSGFGNMMIQQGEQLLVYGAVMTGLAPALANPFTAGPAALHAGAALLALGAAFATIAGAMSSGNTTGSGGAAFTDAYSPTSRISTVYSGPGGAGNNPVSGLPNPTGQQPITVNVNGPILGSKDPNVGRFVTDAITQALRSGNYPNFPLARV